ncbi:MAG: hypothetical protein K6T90_01270 [Leptolyngbyaceae cyanobacterium HOT.MB2.61]|nr:hypothetical protein [Leptolyngbyaceae cyanobacterium HOT.MB2.61]
MLQQSAWMTSMNSTQKAALAMLWGMVLQEPVTGVMIVGCGVILLGTAIANGLTSRTLIQ